MRFRIRLYEKLCVYLVPFSSYSDVLSKVADFNITRLHLAPPLGVTSFEFRRDLTQQKTRVTGLSCGVNFVIICFAVLVEHRLVTDGQTHRRTDGHTTTAYTALA